MSDAHREFLSFPRPERERRPGKCCFSGCTVIWADYNNFPPAWQDKAALFSRELKIP
ncbi:MAG: hypothetical protein K2L38_07025 [Dysosmobacter sp.]|nr:hypothetical protein [Dysosmobacter sp.]